MNKQEIQRKIIVDTLDEYRYVSAYGNSHIANLIMDKLNEEEPNSELLKQLSEKERRAVETRARTRYDLDPEKTFIEGAEFLAKFRNDENKPDPNAELLQTLKKVRSLSEDRGHAGLNVIAKICHETIKKYESKL